MEIALSDGASSTTRALWGSGYLLGPTPTNISMNSEPLMERNGTPASPAVALANNVLPVPGGP